MSTFPSDAKAVVLTWEWTLQASPEALWPFVSDTNRINVLAGMAPVTFTDTPLPQGGSRRVGESKMLGMPVSWDEHPFQWVYPERFHVVRSFHSGPLSAYKSTVELKPHGTGTRLVHTVRIVPHSWLLNPFVKGEGAQLQKKWERAYRIIDDHLSTGGPHPYGAPRQAPVKEPVPAIAERILAAGQAPDAVSRLVSFVLSEHETNVQHMRPFALAERWNLSRTTALELCMTAAACGLLESRWSHLCPQCRGPKAFAEHPDQLPDTAECRSCGISFTKAGEETVELAFRPAASIRKVTGATYCVGGPGATPHVLFQGEMGPSERIELNLPVGPGMYRIRTVTPAAEAVFHFNGTESAATGMASVTLSASGIQAPAEPVAGSALRLALENQAERTQVVLERTEWGSEIATAGHVRATPSFQAFVTAQAR